MRISSIGYNFNRNNLYKKNTNNIKKDNVAFSSKRLNLHTDIKNINSIKYPDELYLSEKTFKNALKVSDYHTVRNELPFYLTWVMGDLLAKRCNYLHLSTKPNDFAWKSFPEEKDENIPQRQFFMIRDNNSNVKKDMLFEWTEEFNELIPYFRNKKNTYSFKDNLEKISKEVPEILKKQGWMK